MFFVGLPFPTAEIILTKNYWTSSHHSGCRALVI
jgi:hypothetical protein